MTCNLRRIIPPIRCFREFTTRWTHISVYQDLEQLLVKQRKLNVNTPLGCAEYGLDNPEPTVRTMLGLGTGYLDQYLFRGGSQFAWAAKGYEFAGYSPDVVVEEGGFVLPKYRG